VLQIHYHIVEVIQEDREMKVEQVRAIAAEMGIKAGKMKKAELIRSIQKAEGNEECFDTGRAQLCGQQECLWREDCR
jgi:hypothetical protein